MSESSETVSGSGRDRAIASGIMTLVWRMLLLVVGGSFAFGGGMLLAIQNPQPVARKPLVVNLWESWQKKGSATETNVAPNPEQEELLQEIAQLQSQEAEGNSENIRTQIEALQEQLQSDSALRTDKLKVTLPSDFLFSDVESTLSLEAKEILDEYVVNDLQQYEGKTIYISAYTDGSDNLQLNQELSFRRAQAIENYLDQALDGNYRWITVGYGKSNDADLDESFLNRRIEIAVE